MAKAFIGWRYPTAITALDLQPSGFRDAGAALPDDAEAIASWLDFSGSGNDFDAVGSPLYEATGTYALLNGTSGGNTATPKYFERTSDVDDLAIQAGTDFMIIMGYTPIQPVDAYDSIATHITNAPLQTRWGTGLVMEVASVSSDLYEGGIAVADDIHPSENGTPDIGAHQFKLGRYWFGPRKLHNGYLCGIPTGWEKADPADAASETGISDSGTAVLYFKNGTDYIAAWKRSSSGSTRWTDFDTELGTYYLRRDGLGIKTDYSEGALVMDDGLLVVYYSCDDDVAQEFNNSLYTPYSCATQQTSYGVTSSGNLTGYVGMHHIYVRVPWQSGDANCTVEYKLAHEATYRQAMDAHLETNGSDPDEWVGIICNLAPGETYDIRTVTAGEGTLTTTAVTRQPNKIPTGTVHSATTSNIATILALPPDPGDIIELAAGNYVARTITISGTQSLPIMFRPADESDPPVLARWTINGSDLWLDGLKSRYSSSVGMQIGSGTTRVHVSRCDIDGEGAAQALECIRTDGDEAIFTDNWIAGGDPPRPPYHVSSINESFAGEGILAYDSVGVEMAFNDISRVGDCHSYGAENIIFHHNRCHDYTDDIFEADHSLRAQACIYNFAFQGGNNAISTQGGGLRGPVWIIGNQITGAFAVASNQSGTFGGSFIKDVTATLHTPIIGNTITGHEGAKHSDIWFEQDDNIFCNNVWLCKKRIDGQNRIGEASTGLAYGADADWSGHMRIWSNNAYAATSTVVYNFTVKTLTAIQAKNVEAGSVLLANYGSTVCPAIDGDWRKCLIYIGPDGCPDPYRPHNYGIAATYNSEEGYTFRTVHSDGTEDEIATLPFTNINNPTVIAFRYQWSAANGKQIFLDDGSSVSVDTVVAQASPLGELGEIIARIGANGLGENPLQGCLSHVQIFTDTVDDATLNSAADAIATAIGTTWTSI